MVNSKNYKQFKYISDYRYGALEELTDDELEAQKYHVKEIYGQSKLPCFRTLIRISVSTIQFEQCRRKIIIMNKKKKGKCKYSKRNICDFTEECCVGDESMATVCEDYEEEEELANLFEQEGVTMVKGRRKSLVGWAMFYFNYSTKEWDLVRMLNPEGGLALFHNEESANKCEYISQALTGGVVKVKITKVLITIEELGGGK